MKRIVLLSLGLALLLPASGSADDSNNRRFDSVEAQGPSLAAITEMLGEIRARYVEPISDEELIGTVLETLGRRDRYSQYLSPDEFRRMREQQRGTYAGIGARYRRDADGLHLIEVLDGSPAAAVGIRAGDIIVAVDGQPVLDGAAVPPIRGPEGETVALTVLRSGAGQPTVLNVVRGEVVMPAVKSETIGDVGYIRIRTFNRQANAGVRSALQDLAGRSAFPMHGLIIDLRGNRGGLVRESVAIADAFLDHGTIVTQQARDARDERIYQARPGDVSGGLPIVVLVDGTSASASEILTAALQDHDRAIVVGTKTYGKGVVQTIIRLDNGGALKLTTARYHTPSGRSVDGVGVMPDRIVEAPATGAPGWSEPPNPATDPQLALAVDILRGVSVDGLSQPAQLVKTSGPELPPLTKAVAGSEEQFP